MTKEDYHYGREYFEDGCLCIKSGIIEKKDSTAVPDETAYNYYNANCKCSRHPEYKGE